MTLRRLLLPIFFVFALGTGAALAADEPRKVVWEDLMPNSGAAGIKSLDLDGDGSVTDAEMAQGPKMMSAVPQATVPELDGKLVRIPAFIVPLDGTIEELTELLLVPYFGACIHVPPPPPNQIIHVQPKDKGIKVGDLDIWGAVYATGILRTEFIEHDLAEIGYKMEVQKLEPYTAEK